jgi:hypothetical protein
MPRPPMLAAVPMPMPRPQTNRTSSRPGRPGQTRETRAAKTLSRTASAISLRRRICRKRVRPGLSRGKERLFRDGTWWWNLDVMYRFFA